MGPVLDNNQDKTVVNESMANTQPLTEDNFEPASEAPYADNVAQIKTDINKQVENAIENGTPEQVRNIAQNAPKPIANEAKQVLDNNPKNDEVNNEAVEEGIKSPGSSFLNLKDYQSARKLSDKELKGRLPKEPKLLNNLMRDTLSNGEYEGSFDDKVFDFGDSESGTTVDPILQDLSSRYPDLKYSELASNPEAFKYYTESRNKRNKRLGDSGETIQGTSLEDLVDMFGDAYLENPKKYAKEALEGLIETKPEQVLEDPKMPVEAKEEAAQVLDSDKRNDEANNEQVEKAADELITSEQEAESLIEENPEVADEALPENTESKEEAEQITEEPGNTTNDEVNNEEIKEDIKAEQQGLIDWDKVKVYEPGEDATGYGIEKESFDPRVEENLNYDYDQNIPQDDTFETSITNTTQDFSPDVVDYGLEDQNQYGAELPSEDETIIDEKMSNTEPLSDDNFEPAPEAPYADNVVQLKQQKEQLDKELEEAEAEPVTDKESAIRKQNRLKMARAAIANFNASNPSFNNQIQQSNGSISTGSRVSPSAGIGNIGGGASGHGSMASVGPTKMAGDSHSSIASKAPLSVALEDNQGRVVSVNGKATTMPVSSKNGSMRSGSFGLMSKPSKGIKVSKPAGVTSSGAYHTQSNGSMKSKQVDGIEQVATDGKEALIERIKALLKELPDEEVSKLGFSPVRNTYKGKSLEHYDGYTLQNLSKQLENLIGKY